jgi:hypothetical protein
MLRKAHLVIGSMGHYAASLEESERILIIFPFEKLCENVLAVGVSVYCRQNGDEPYCSSRTDNTPHSKFCVT